MKKAISMLCIFAVLLAALTCLGVGAEETAPAPEVPAEASKWDGVVPEANKDYVFEGEGTEESPWLIKSAADLAQLAANARLNDEETTYSGKFFELTVDIDIDNQGWWAIGGCRPGTDGLPTKPEEPNRFSYFAGTFDGGNHKIYNFALANTTEVLNEETQKMETKVLHQQGLFGVIVGATIRNLGIESGNVTLENSNRSAAFCGVGRFGFLIENCYNKADVTITTNYKATFVGAFMGQVIDPWSNGANTEGTHKGVFQKKQLKNIYNTGNLTVTLNQPDGANEFRIGSIAGQYVGGSPEMLNVYSLCDVTVVSNSVASSKNNHRVGGITGAYLDTGYAENLYYQGKITFQATVVTDMSKYNLGILIGNVSGSFSSDPDVDGKYTIGYCAKEGSNIEKSVGNHTTQAVWNKAVDEVVIPLAEDCDFIVDIYAEPETPDDPNPPVDTGDETDPPEENTTAPKPDGTQQPSETTGSNQTNAPSGSKEKGGCASVVGMGAVLLIASVASGVGICLSCRKNKED